MLKWPGIEPPDSIEIIIDVISTIVLNPKAPAFQQVANQRRGAVVPTEIQLAMHYAERLSQGEEITQDPFVSDHPLKNGGIAKRERE
jgi:hypothetical protein